MRCQYQNYLRSLLGLTSRLPELFFFSSRRRHTRWPRDWSSDVCSSDLRTGRPTQVPRVTAPIRRREPVLVADVRFARANTDRLLRFTVPGPFTMTQQCQDDCYGDE